MLIAYPYPEAGGWSSIDYMVELAQELFDAELLSLPPQFHLSLPSKLSVAIPRLRGRENCLFICACAADLPRLFTIPGWRTRFRKITAWVIDSFWTDWIPRLIRYSRVFDHLFLITAEDVPTWRKATGTPASCLTCGTDSLRLPPPATDAEPEIDVLRIGRMPPEWDDDDQNRRDFERLGLRYQGRVPGFKNPLENQTQLMSVWSRAKFTLAFSNIASPATYTHPTAEYLTARWTDALSCGTILAGIHPTSPSIDELLWPGATIDFPSVRKADGLPVLAEAVPRWRPEYAAHNRLMARQRLDWRWRFAEIARVLDEHPPKLQAELDQLRAAIRDGAERAPAAIHPAASPAR